MNATVDPVAKEEVVTIEVDGRILKAHPGTMLIEATDAAGIDIPRFCYHKKLSVAANCRMCLVEVMKAPKPLPACATPVADGMKVFTKSPLAIAAQQGTMEFLLINHPLDCPICDQGGECELQEVSIGYGSCHSEYREPKRVVPDKDIGPLIATEMTRCIHCTRCVRFGEEIAGIRELGATGRGERMRIGTYIETAVASELSGNVIDLCPVGALTSKPFRFTARAWEMETRQGIASHDCVGSNIELRVRSNTVMRVDPHENEAINEVWISDRDRFSYQGLNVERLTQPQIKKDGKWQETDWQTALNAAVTGMKAVIEQQGAEVLNALASANATTEELFLLQKLVRALGSTNIDHRLRQTDTSAQQAIVGYPSLGRTLASLSTVDAALLIGSHVRKDQPMIAHRLRQAALRGGEIMFVNTMDYDFNFPVHQALVKRIDEIEQQLAGITKALMPSRGKVEGLDGLGDLLKGLRPTAAQKAIADSLAAAKETAILIGLEAQMWPNLGVIQSLAKAIAELSGATVGFLTEGANTAGAWLAGALPHRCAAAASSDAGNAVGEMFEKNQQAYLLLNIEPDFDLAIAAKASRQLAEAAAVVVMTAYDSPSLRAVSDVMLPVAPYSETSGTYVNVEGKWQSFSAAVAPQGEARPAWKVLRVLGNLFALDGFEQMSSRDVVSELAALVSAAETESGLLWQCPEAISLAAKNSLLRIGTVPPLASDPVVRRAQSLQRTADAVSEAVVAMNDKQAKALGLHEGDRVFVRQEGDYQTELDVVLDNRVPLESVYIPSAVPGSEALAKAFGTITLESVSKG